jgi:PBP1b-binding outer membrane lipoprotein LpoB
MKTMKYIFLLALGSSLIMSCGGKKDGSENATGNDSTDNTKTEVKNNSGEKPASSNSSVDLSTPTKAIESFIQSGQSQNLDALSQCFSKNSEREFQMIVNKELKEKDLLELKEFTTDSKVLDETVDGNKAVVKVKFSKRDEKVTLESVDGKWQIVSF